MPARARAPDARRNHRRPLVSVPSQISHPAVPGAPASLREVISSIPQPDYSSPRFKANPFPYYARLRAEAPVFLTPVFPLGVLGKRRGWLVTRYDDVVTVLKHPALSKDPFRAISGGRRA